MLAVAHAKACRLCVLVHRRWPWPKAYPTLNSPRSRPRTPDSSTDAPGPRSAWSDARARADLGPVPVEFEDELARHYSAAERDDLDLVTTVMTVANRSANTVDALLARLRGRPVPGSRLLDELLNRQWRCTVDPACGGIPGICAPPAPALIDGPAAPQSKRPCHLPPSIILCSRGCAC